MRDEVAALFRDVYGRLDGLVVALAFAGLELAAVGGAELPRVLRALRVRHEPDEADFFISLRPRGHSQVLGHVKRFFKYLFAQAPRVVAV